MTSRISATVCTLVLLTTSIAAAQEAELVVLSLFVIRDRTGDATPFREADLALLRQVIRENPGRVVAIAYGNPHLIREIPQVPAFLVGYGERGWYGNQAVYFDTFVRALTGELAPTGRLPVFVSSDYPKLHRWLPRWSRI